MKKYISPVYEGEEISVNDIVLSSTSRIKDAGEGGIGDVSGKKGVVENDFNSIF